jgi:hypothetical protein
MNIENAEKRKQGRPKDNTFPTFVTCRVTGKQSKINVTLLRRQLQKNGKTIEEYLSNYVSREGKHIEEDASDTTQVLPPINPDLGKAIEVEERVYDEDTLEKRKVIIKDLWNKIAQQPPEYYQEQFKIRGYRGK